MSQQSVANKSQPPKKIKLNRSAAGFMTETSRKRSSSAADSVATVVCAAAGESEDSSPAAKKKKSFVAKPIQWP